MCGSSSPQAPTPPNAQQTAQTQAGYNQAAGVQTAQLNQYNQSNPYATSTYQITGYNPDGTPIYSQSTQLSPQEQNILSQYLTGQTNAGTTAAGINLSGLAQPLNTSSLPGIASAPTNGAGNPGAIQSAEQAAFNTQEQFLQPLQQQATQQTENQLINEGLQPGSQAYNNAMQVLNNSQNQQTQAAENSAVTAGQNEQNLLYGQGVTGAQLQNSADAQALAQLLTEQQNPYQNYAELQSTAQPTQGTFQSTPTASVQPTNYSSDVYNTYQGQLNTYDAQMAAQNSLMSGLFGLGGAAVKGIAGSPTILAALGLSDKRAKKNIRHVGETPGGHKLYEFDYKKGVEPFGLGGGKHVGVMAQEIEKTQPEAVWRRASDGMRAVDYSRVA